MKIARNIPLLFAMQIFRWFLMIMPTIVLFFQENGLSLFQVMVVQASFSLSMFLFEIPSGYFSDKIGRKITIIVGLLFSTIGMYLFGLAPGFWNFILAEVLLGIGSSFLSGTDSSLLYDTLLELKDEKNHYKTEGLYMSIASYSEGIASIIGGIIAVYSMKMNFYIEGTLEAIAFILAFFLIEPKIKREGTSSLTFSHFIKDIKSTFSNSKTLYLVTYGAFSGLGTFLALWYIQPELASREFPLVLFGGIWAGLNVVVGICSNLSHKIFSKKEPLKILRFIPFVLSLSYFSLIFLPGFWIIIGFLSFYIIRGLKGPLERNLIHQEVNSQNRATVLSVQSMFMRVSFVITGPLFALLARDDGNSIIYLSIGLFFMILAILNFIYSKKVNI
ncbi:MAG: MFS transporter [Spirochaetaceae bacterium]